MGGGGLVLTELLVVLAGAVGWGAYELISLRRYRARHQAERRVESEPPARHGPPARKPPTVLPG